MYAFFLRIRLKGLIDYFFIPRYTYQFPFIYTKFKEYNSKAKQYCMCTGHSCHLHKPTLFYKDRIGVYHSYNIIYMDSYTFILLTKYNDDDDIVVTSIYATLMFIV